MLGVEEEKLKGFIARYIEQIKKTLRMASLSYSKDLSGFDMVFCFSFYCLLIMFFPTEPPDDLLRHMKAYTYGYDYRQMWPFSPGLPSFNMYYLFDVFTGAVHHILGPFSFVLIQVLAITLYAVAIYWMLQGASSRNWRFTLMMIILTLVLFRVMLARPSTFASGLFLLALATCNDNRVKWWMHLILGCIIACVYHLFFIYLIPLAIYRRSYVVSLVCGITGWVMFAGTEYFHAIQSVMTIDSHRAGLLVAESQPIWHALLPTLFIILPVLFYWRKDVKRLLASGWFLLSNRMRYIEVLAPALASYAKHWDVKLSQLSVSVIVISLCFYRPTTHMEDSWIALKGAVPPGSRVLCLHSDPMYKMVYANEGLKLSPCMDAGWDTDEIKTAIRMAVEDGKLYRKVLQSGHYEFIVENNLKEIPQGLSLYKISGKYRIWKVPPFIFDRNGAYIGGFVPTGAPTGNAAAIGGNGGKPCPGKS
jgi:hypothetical protein